LAERVDFAAQIAIYTLAFPSQVKVGGNVVAMADEVGFVGQHVFQALFLAHDLLGFLWIRPEGGIGGLLFDLGQTLAQVASVKDTPEVRELCLSGVRILFPALRP
jgi:hypothetical protein